MIAELEAEFGGLTLDRFDEAVAMRLGLIMMDLAKDKPVVINIRNLNRVYFHLALPGSTPLNDLWARRKSNTALLFELPSLLVGEKNLAKGGSLADHGLSEADYADHGGAVPIRTIGNGVAAVATVSGLPSLDDHQLVVAALQVLNQR